jgi:hypothetical protein
MNTTTRLLLAFFLLLGSSLALADHRDNNRGYNRGWDRHDSGWNGRHDSWSVGISIGNNIPLYTNRYDSGYPFVFNPSLGFIRRSSLPYTRGYGQNRTVVINNTWIDSSPATRVIRSAPVQAGRSLLRDRYGRCYERETDRYGNETRIELPATKCDF